MARERSVSDICEVLALGWSFRGELCISREICTVPSLYRPSTDGLIRKCIRLLPVCALLAHV